MIHMKELKQLGDLYPSFIPSNTPSPLSSMNTKSHPNRILFRDNQNILQRLTVPETLSPDKPAEYRTDLFTKAGPRSVLQIDPCNTIACIATCGGLCPGLNVCVYQIYRTLKDVYGVKTIYGVFDGFRGFVDDSKWVELTEDLVRHKFNESGTFLRTSRGRQDMKHIAANLGKRGVNAVFIVGGEGSHKGADALQSAAIELNIQISVAAIPKTIDNDIPLIAQSFGHSTAIEVVLGCLKSAYTEVSSIDPCLGIVKNMGRDTGHISVNSALAFGKVDVVLIPESGFKLYGKCGLLQYMCDTLKTKRHMVLLVSEGASSNMQDGGLADTGKDKSGNTKFGDIGNFLKSKIGEYCKQNGGESLKELNIKYIDPSYLQRSGQPNALDRTMCLNLSRDSVHGVMAGFTSFSTAIVEGRSAYLPLGAITSKKREYVDLSGERYQSLLQMTRQPTFLEEAALDEDSS